MATRGVALTVPFMAINSSTGAEVTGDAANITPRKVRDGVSSALTTATVTEVDSTNFPGLYSVAVSSGEADCNLLQIGGKSATSNVKIIPTFIQMERLPDAAPGASGGVPTGDGSGRVQVQYGTSTGQINLSAGNLAGAVPSVTGAVGSVTGAVGSVTGSVGSVSGNVGGSVASVTGDVGGKVLGGGSGTITGDGVQASSVTGNVGGNVTGSVGSVAGAVASVTNPVTLTSAYDAAKTAASATNLSTAQTGITTLLTNTQDLPVMITGDGTAGAKFTTTALSNAPGGSGGSGAPVLYTSPLSVVVEAGASDEQFLTLRRSHIGPLRVNLVDASKVPISTTGATLTAAIYSPAGTELLTGLEVTELLGDEGQVSVQADMTEAALTDYATVNLTITRDNGATDVTTATLAIRILG